MKLAGLSPEAHGTLHALRNLSEVRRFDRRVAHEPVERRYAELVERKGETAKLCVTDEGRAVKLFAAADGP
jgi:hypothetical protein